MFKKILVPLDGSQLAERALIPALTLAKASNGEVLIVRTPVYGNEYVTAAAGLSFTTEKEHSMKRNTCNNYLRAVRQTHIDFDTPIRYKMGEGDPASVILDQAQAEDIDLIVMTTHGRTGFTRWMFGSVTERVLRAAPCPVLALRDDITPTKILIPLDGSELAEHSLAPGLAVAKGFESDVTLLRVQVPFLDLDETQQDEVLGEKNEWMFTTTEAMHRTAVNYLEKTQAAYTTPELPIRFAVISNLAADGILIYAEDHQFNLIVMTTHGFTGLGRWDYGSTTSKVMRSTQQAMLIVPAPRKLLN
jgi:nucleotide-binding universal stress UspA family protein